MSEIVKFSESKVVQEVERTEVLDAALAVPVIGLGAMAGLLFGIEPGMTSMAAAGVYVAGSTAMNRAFLKEMLKKSGFTSSKAAHLPMKAWLACVPLVGRNFTFQHEAIIQDEKGRVKEVVVDFDAKNISVHEEIIKEPMDSWDTLFESETGTKIKKHIDDYQTNGGFINRKEVTSKEILAARGRVAVDRSLGRTTPVHVEDIAKLEL